MATILHVAVLLLTHDYVRGFYITNNKRQVREQDETARVVSLKFHLPL